ncbi:uncharacterized protein (DUF58 family) [Halorubrum alkaliphilum]|uniref:Uncharacterized protein (DUF58 family) n=1 Tax=Halorubrum alkaliphilum TaxID=261290 RepID=A0A8T4GFT1_9EURY|nr:DUF58 domain-containing protein [Halorubrum alkaliphilum]MBP1923368.1 uncharacterized protein (DUF58 family) [Halorubrum alkaliphilum]
MTSADPAAIGREDGAGRDEVERFGARELYGALALALVGAGVVVGSPTLVVAALVPLAFVAAGGSDVTPDRSVRFTRRVGGENDDVSADGSTVSGDPGDAVTVRTTVHNVGDGPLVDLRVADGVPADLPVVAGTPRTATRLDPGESATVEYELELRRGTHGFADPVLRVRSLDGSARRTWTPAVDDDVTIRCAPAVDDVPLGDGTNDRAGDVPADEDGSGVEFHSVREYESGDPVRSIDWRRYARTRELSTVEYRAERSTTVVCVVDVRESERRTPAGSSLPAAALSVDAAERTALTLMDAGHPSGVVCLYERGALSVDPGTDATTRERTRTLLSAAGEGDRPEGSIARSRHGSPAEVLAAALPGEAHVYLFSSFVDDGLDTLPERLRAGNHAVRVVSPDVLSGGTDDAARIGSIARDNRLARARESGARVVDWDPDRSLELVVREAVGEGRTR